MTPPSVPPASVPPGSIGPYRLEQRLGEGGMGEVYRGFDARLDRPVALKRIRPGLGDQDIALRRFRREARASARLRHPAIVQVHDWVETEEHGAWLVMELVEGSSLRDILRRGCLVPARARSLAEDLLEGLSVAHEAGLVHRDLKAENIMVSPAGSSSRGRSEQAKILDFGLAKNAVLSNDETRVSVDGKIIGTLTAMAPEQVLGLELDGRADLFALGSLLYEALTGVQPFVGSSAGETLHRVCTTRQAPVQELEPDVPLGLSRFIDSLLEKDPRRRPASAAEALDELDRLSTQFEQEPLSPGDPLNVKTAVDGMLGEETLEGVSMSFDAEVSPFNGPAPSGLNLDGSGSTSHEAGSSGAVEGPAAISASTRSRPSPQLALWLLTAIALAALTLSGILLYRSSKPAPEASSIYVAVPETVILDSTTEADLELTANAVQTAIFQGLVDFPNVVALEVPQAAVAISDSRQLAKVMAADDVLRSTIECHEGGCLVDLKKIRGVDGRVMWVQEFKVRPQQFLEVSRAVIGYLPMAYASETRRAEAFAFEVRPSDFEGFLRLVRNFEKREQGLSTDGFLEGLEAIGVSSPGFVSVPIQSAYATLQRFEERHQEHDLDAAHRAIDRARRLAPSDPQVLMLAARAARLSGDLGGATELLDQVLRLQPGNVDAQFALARLFEERGEIDEALSVSLAATSQLPSASLHFNTASMLYRHGKFEAAREQIELGLRLDPESFSGLSRLAQLELAHGDIERSAKLYRDLVERSAESTEIGNLGTALMMLGRYDEAAELFRQVVEESPDSPFTLLNLADVEKLAGRLEVASNLYSKVVELAEADPNPLPLASVKAQALAHLGNSEAAVAAIQEALRQQPNHPWRAYEAALVHALNGDRTSALWNARRALSHGIKPRWFDLPWFDAMREEILAAESR